MTPASISVGLGVITLAIVTAPWGLVVLGVVLLIFNWYHIFPPKPMQEKDNQPED